LYSFAFSRLPIFFFLFSISFYFIISIFYFLFSILFCFILLFPICSPLSSFFFLILFQPLDSLTPFNVFVFNHTQNQSSSSVADLVPSIPWQIVSILLEKKSENSADKITENFQLKIFQASLLESLFNILESGSESAELVDYPVERGIGGGKVGVELSQRGETEQRRKSMFTANTRLALCNAVLPTLLLILTPTPTPTPTPTLTQDPPKCENERFSFLSVRFLFSAVGVVSDEKRPAFLALVLPPISDFLCSLLAGAHTAHTQHTYSTHTSQIQKCEICHVLFFLSSFPLFFSFSYPFSFTFTSTAPIHYYIPIIREKIIDLLDSSYGQ
jgi:hypothetical protein